MNLRERIFGSFDFAAVDDPAFKEDSVREEIIAPLLRSIGYASSGENKILRSHPLLHPYVMFGSQRKKLSIIPDYLLSVKGKNSFVLDAKSPRENIVAGDNVAQVYSYAIHPEVRSWNYGLCNGRLLALFEVTSIEPKRVFDLTKVTEADLLEINQKLNPRSISSNDILGYHLDGGAYLHFVINMPLENPITFTSVPLTNVSIISGNHYTFNTMVNDMTDRPLAMTFDFDARVLSGLLSGLPLEMVQALTSGLKSYPYQYRNVENPPIVHITCKQTTKPAISQKGEMFFPLNVLRFQT